MQIHDYIGKSLSIKEVETIEKAHNYLKSLKHSHLFIYYIIPIFVMTCLIFMTPDY